MTAQFTPETLPGDAGYGMTRVQFVNHAIRFIQSDFKETLFTKSFYRVLCQKFGHIAHYGQAGFYHTWFATDEQRLAWLEYIIRGGLYSFCPKPEEQALKEWVIESGKVTEYHRRVNDATERAERAELARLKAKYE